MGIFAVGQGSPTNQFIEAPVVGNPYQGVYTTFGTADFNGDGRADLLITNYYPNLHTGLLALLRSATTQYISKPVSDSATRPWGDPQIADMNGDGIPDIVTASEGNRDSMGNFTTQGAIDVYVGNGDGTFKNHRNIATGQFRTPFLVDANGDGRLDIVVGAYPAGSSTASGVQAFLNDGHGNFIASPLLVLNTNYDTVIVAASDINHDGHIDLLTGPESGVAQPSSQPYTIAMGVGTGLFEPGGTLPYSLPLPFTPFRSPVADYNGDGFLDFPILDSRTNSIVMLRGSSSGALTPAQFVHLPSNENIGQMATADFNGDGKPDLALSIDAPDAVAAVYTGLGNGKLSAPRYYAESRGFGGMLAGDFTGDGKPDLIAGSGTLLINDGKGFFRAPVLSQTVPFVPASFAAGDFNRDGVSDVAVMVSTNDAQGNCVGSVRVSTGSGAGYYSAARVYPVGAGSGLIAAGDINHDGILDLVVAGIPPIFAGSNCNSANDQYLVSVLLGKPDGTFAPSIDQGFVIRRPGGVQQNRSVYLVDMDGDGNLDLVGLWGVALGNGDGTFRSTNLFNADDASDRDVAVGDFNNDGHPDVAIAINSNNPSGPANYIKLLINNGQGGFSNGGTIDFSNGIGGLKFADLNADGKQDLLVTATTTDDQQQSALFVALGKGNGTFATPIPFARSTIGVGAYIQTADFDRDGKLDVVLQGSGGVVYYRGLGSGVLELPAFYPSAAGAGLLVTDVDGINGPDVLTLNGLGFTRLLNTGRRAP